jgi:RHS repeat-associated protein
MNGAVVWRAKYESFGEASVEVETVENNLRFPGQYYDQETGLHYNLWRYYSTEAGRYLRTDPLKTYERINAYSYGRNSPISWIDPFGLSSLYYDNEEDTIILFDSSGFEVARATADNNTASNSQGPFPDGTFPIRQHPPAYQTHPGDAPNSSYGTYGSLNFIVPGRTNMAVHSGRATVPDGLGRTGTEHATMGCIRTTDEMMREIIAMHNSSDPITELTVGFDPPSGTSCD